MGRRGKQPAPTAIKIAKGTLKKRDGDPKLAPAVGVVTACPPPPDSLGEKGRDAWLDYVPLMIKAGYFADIDQRAFERFCRAHDEVYKCDLVLTEEGEHYPVGEHGAIAQHPAVNQRFKWLDIIRRYEIEFWLTPTSRSGKQVAKAKSGIRTLKDQVG